MKFAPYLAILFLVTLTFLAFSSSVGNDFVNWDDEYYVTEKPVIRTASLDHIIALFSDFYVGLYVPVTMLSYMVDYHIWMSNPFGYHLTNLILHIINVILVFLFLRKLRLDFTISLIAAAVFAVHPVQVESVAWISERKSLLSTVLFFLSFFAYIRYSRLKPIPFYILSIILFAVAGLAKPSVVVLPLLLLSYDYFYGEKKININQIKDKLPYFILAALFGFVTIYAHRGSVTETFIHGGMIISHVITVFSILTNYLGLVFYPVGLSALYELTVYTSIFDIKPLIGIVVSALSVFYLIYFAKKKDQRGFWIFWFFILMMPIMHVVPYLESYNERYLYLSILSFPVLIYYCAVSRFWSLPWARYAFVVTAAVIITVLSFLSYERCEVWQDGFTLWRDVLETTPNSHKAHTSLGTMYEREGDYGRAIAEHKTALRIKPDYSMGWSNLGVAYEKAGLIDEAVKAQLQAIKLDPENENAYNGLGICYARKGLHDEAIWAYEKALALHPEYDKAYTNISVVYLRKGLTDKALWAAKRAVMLKPDYAKGYNNLGNAYITKGQYNQGIAAYRHALQLDPDLPSAKKNLAVVFKFLEERETAKREQQT